MGSKVVLAVVRVLFRTRSGPARVLEGPPENLPVTHSAKAKERKIIKTKSTSRHARSSRVLPCARLAATWGRSGRALEQCACVGERAAQCGREKEYLELTAQRLERSGTDAEFYGGEAERAVKVNREHLPCQHYGLRGRATFLSPLSPGKDSACRGTDARHVQTHAMATTTRQTSSTARSSTLSAATHGASGGAAETHLVALGGAIAGYWVATVVQTSGVEGLSHDGL